MSNAEVFDMGKVRQWIHRLLGLDVVCGEIQSALEGLDLDVKRLQGAVDSLERSWSELRGDVEYLTGRFNEAVTDPLEGLQVRMDQLECARDVLRDSVADLRNQLSRLDSHVRRRFSVHGWHECQHCRGDGLVYVLASVTSGGTLRVQCKECDGLGYVLPKPQQAEAS